jgi:hypothetical protein
MVKAMTGLLSLGRAFRAVSRFGQPLLQRSLDCQSTQQCLDAPAAGCQSEDIHLGELRKALERADHPQGLCAFEIDTFVMNNSETKKEYIGRTYQGVDGYCPIAGYLGNEGWNVGLELRAGSHHSALETEYFYERAFPRVKRLTKAIQAVLMVEDSGFDSARLLFAKALERDAWATEGRVLEFICKWNPRKQDKVVWVAQAEKAGTFKEVRPGKRVALLDLQVERAWRKEKRTFRLITQVTERTIDRKGQHLLVPDIQIAAAEVIEHYRITTHEQFHSRSRPTRSGAFAVGQVRLNDAILGCAALPELPAPDRTVGLTEIADPASGQAQKAEDRPPRDHVPGGKVCRTRQKPAARLRPQLCRPCQGVCGVARPVAASGIAMTATSRRFSTKRSDSASAEGNDSPWSRKMT